MTTIPRPATDFTLLSGSEAVGPPEQRGLTRDGVRLAVARPGRVKHRRFRELPDLLEPGDLLVVNTSATLPAALDAHRQGQPTPVHLSTRLDDGTWVVEVRRRDGAGPDLSLVALDRLDLPGGVGLRLLSPYPDPTAAKSRLWQAIANTGEPLEDYLRRYGRPIGYGYLSRPCPLADYQTIFGTQAGSAEMASAGRPFTDRMVVRVLARGITVAPIVLHAGVSSSELHEPPLAERFEVPADTARLVNSARAAGRRVVAVGTTVVRALETVADAGGTVSAASGWTELVLGPDRSARVVSGLVTGLHAPQASHLLLLEAVAGGALVRLAYDEALAHHYLWHEFGDSTLFLP